MKMNQIVIASFFFFSVLLSCTGQANRSAFITNNTESCETLKLVETYYLDKDSVASLEILRDESENYILLQTKFHDKISSVAGTGNIDFLNGKLRLDTVFFEKDKEVFVLPTYVYGSTYGAVVYFLIYEDNYSNNWEITKIPFDRLDIMADTDNKEFFNILRYTIDDKTVKYVFKEGVFLQQAANEPN